MSESTSKGVPERTEEAVQAMHDALVLYVKRIEGSAPTTRNRYGDYMALISVVEGVVNQRGLARALIKVGANKWGVEDGFAAATGEDL